MSTFIRPALLTATEDGNPLVLGMGKPESRWPAGDFRSIERDLAFIVNFMANEPLYVADFSAKKLLGLISEVEIAALERSAEESGLVDVLIHLYAFLSSGRAFVDQTDRELKSQFGETSTERVGFQSALKATYDGSAEYRFLYALRNHAQHRSVPLSRSHHSRSRLVSPGGDDEHVEDTFEVTCDRDALLADSDWKPVVREWLRAQPPSFEIAPVVECGSDCLRSIGLELHKLVAPHVMLAHERVKPFWEAFMHPPPPLKDAVEGTVGYMELDTSAGDTPAVVAFVEVPRQRYMTMLSLAQRLLDDDEPGKVLITCLPLEGGRMGF